MEAIKIEPQLEDAETSIEPAVSSRLLLPHFPLLLSKVDSTERDQIEQFISRRFRTVYGAKVTHFMPYLLSTHTDHTVCGALGFQPATSSEPLFLEHYLSGPIETVLSQAAEMPIERENIVEIGNLASGRQRATQTLFVLLADILQRSRYEWVVFTANNAVQAWLETLHLRCVTLGEADPSLLPDKGASWGTYYDDKPVVLACHIKPGFEAMKQDRLIEFLRQSYRIKIEEFIEELKK